MSPTFSTGVIDLPRSGIRRIYDEAARYPDCIRLEVGEPGFGTPEHIKHAASEAMAAGFTRYTPNAGIPELREALAVKLRNRNGIEATADQIIVTNGAVASIFSTLASLVDPGDEVLVSDPSWPNYVQMAMLLGARPVHYRLRLENDLVPTVEDIEAAITDRTKVIIVNSPGNPSGAVIPEQRLREIVELARRYDLWLISDEVYDEIYFDTPPASAFPSDVDGRVISVFSFSKTYAMTGWRVGYLVGSPDLVPYVLRTQEPITSCVNSIAQMAATAAVTGDQRCVTEMRAAYATNAEMAQRLLQEADVPFSRPSGAFYVMVDISASGIEDVDFCSRMISERRVSVVPGSAFGPGSGRFVRVSLASPIDDLRSGLERLAGAVHDWRTP